jgi:hypothetical protein
LQGARNTARSALAKRYMQRAIWSNVMPGVPPRW